MSEDRFTETRRGILKYAGIAAGLGVLASPAVTDPFAHPVAALQSGDQEYVTEDVEIDSFDGTTIAATVYEPEAEGPHPAVLMTHGWGGSRADMQPLADAYASREFVVLAYDSRGFGESSGAVNSTSELEQQDASALIDWLADRDAVLNDGENNPRIGMDGYSYGGGIQLRTASVDDRLDAIVPRATWNNLAQSLAPNGVIKRGWIEALEYGAQAEPAGNISEENTATTGGILERGRMTEEDREYYRQRSPVSYDEIEDTPALVVPELTDQLFPINEGVDNFRKLQSDGSQTTLLLGQDGTHILGQGGDYPPGSGTSTAFVGQVALQWLTAHLKGDGEPDVSTLHYYDGSADEFRAAEEFPPYPERTVTRTIPEAVELDGAEGNVATVDIPVEEATEIVGIPSIELGVTPTGEGRSHLFVALRRVSGGETETIKQQVTPLAIEEAGTIELDLFGVQANLEAGETLQVAMSAREDELTTAQIPDLFGGSIYRPSDDNAGIEIGAETEVGLTVPASAELPQADGSEGSGDGDGSGDDGSGDDGSGGDGGGDDGSGDGSGDGGSGDNEMDDDDGMDDTEESADDGGPGFGVPAALGGAGGLSYLLSKRLGAGEEATDPQVEGDD
jgi:pimeloyl-ACP methyl ester carboxylesterase